MALQHSYLMAFLIYSHSSLSSPFMSAVAPAPWHLWLHPAPSRHSRATPRTSPCHWVAPHNFDHLNHTQSSQDLSQKPLQPVNLSNDSHLDSLSSHASQRHSHPSSGGLPPTHWNPRARPSSRQYCVPAALTHHVLPRPPCLFCGCPRFLLGLFSSLFSTYDLSGDWADREDPF